MNVTFLTDVYEAHGPFATVYLAADPDGTSDLDKRWRVLRDQLLDDGADRRTVAALADRVDRIAAMGPHWGWALVAHGRALVAAEGEVHLDRPTNGAVSAPIHDDARWAPLPHLTPLLPRHRHTAERFAVARRRGNRTIEGMEAVVDALRGGTVATLLLGPAAPAGAHLWVGINSDEFAVSRDELERSGVEEYARGSAADALLRACAGSGAEVEVLGAGDPHLRDGVAALLHR